MKSTYEVYYALKTCPVFSELDTESKARMAELGAIIEYEAGEEVFSMRHPGDSFFLVLSGRLALRLRYQQIKEFGAGQIFGEVSIFDNRTRTGSIKVLESARLVRFSKDEVLFGEILPPTLRLNIAMALTRQIISYLRDAVPVSSYELIMQGEGQHVEFKESASEKHFPKIIQTIAAMQNASGGAIFLGVDDKSAGIVGLRLNNTKRDNIMRSINMGVRQQLGKVPSTLVHLDAEIVEGREIIRIDCDPSPVPVFMTGTSYGKEDDVLYVRINNENIIIKTLRECIRYMQQRFDPVQLSYA